MSVRELMTPRAELITVEPGATVGVAAALLMQHAIGALPVVDGNGTPLGLISERDVVRALHAEGPAAPGLRVERAMRRPPPMCDAGDSIRDVMARMTRERARHLLVCEAGRIAGVVSVGDLVKHRLAQLETETGVLRDYVAGQRARV